MSDHDANASSDDDSDDNGKFDKRAQALRANLRRRKEEAKKQKDRANADKQSDNSKDE